MTTLLDSLFSDVLDSNRSSYVNRSSYGTLKASVKKEDSLYKVEVEVPGAKREDISIEIVGSVLKILVTTKKDSGEFLLNERSFGSFYRTFRLSNLVDKDSIEASLDSGILTVTVKETAKETKKIPIL